MEDISFSENFSFNLFETKLDQAYDIIKSLIESLTDEQWSEDVFMRGSTKTRAEWLIGYVHVFLGAYKMQLFLQLKYAGLSNLGTTNVWGGIDG